MVGVYNAHKALRYGFADENSFGKTRARQHQRPNRFRIVALERDGTSIQGRARRAYIVNQKHSRTGDAVTCRERIANIFASGYIGLTTRASSPGKYGQYTGHC